MGLTDMRPYVESDLEDLADQIIGRYEILSADEGRHWASFAAAVHHYIRTRIDYYDEHDGYFSPRTTWRRGGRCGDQSILAASVFTTFRYPWRVVTVDSPQYERPHALLEVGFPANRFTPQEIEEGLRAFYAANEIPCGRIDRTYEWNGSYLFPMDTEYSDYIGDTSHLVDSGFAYVTADEWGYTDLVEDAGMGYDGDRFV